MKVEITSQDILNANRPSPRRIEPDNWTAKVSGYGLTVKAQTSTTEKEWEIENPEGGKQKKRTLTLDLSREDLIQLFDKAISTGLLRVSLIPCE